MKTAQERAAKIVQLHLGNHDEGDEDYPNCSACCMVREIAAAIDAAVAANQEANLATLNEYHTDSAGDYETQRVLSECMRRIRERFCEGRRA